MTGKIRGKFSGEVAAIRRIRKAHPTLGAMTLAKGIESSKYTDPLNSSTPSNRPLLSTYSVIRRYDADIAAGKSPVTALAA